MQGAYDWFYLLDNAFAALGYYQSKADSCVRSRLINGEYTLMSTHTDDVFGASTTENGATEAKAELDRCFEIKDLGTPSIILGMKISQDSVTRSISLTQKAYLERTLERFGMADCNPKSTPLPPGIDISDDLCPKTEEDRLFMIDKPYRSALRGLMWAQVATRPDLSYTVNTLARFQTNPGPGHWKALMHAYAYVRGTLDYAITYHRGSDETLKPVGYVDANYGRDSGTQRSTSGYVFRMAGGAVSWSSKLQATVALSTAEAEYVAITRAAQQALWMHSFLGEIGLDQTLPTTLYCDNASAIALALSTKGHQRAKHIDIRHHYIRERVSDGQITLQHVPSADNIADVFTKALTKALHINNMKGLYGF